MTLLVCLGVGRLVIWIVQTSGPTRKIWSLRPFLAEFGECDLCVGCWVMPLAAWLFSQNLLAPIYVPVVSEILTGWLMAFGLHLGRLGWQSAFGITYLSPGNDP